MRTVERYLNMGSNKSRNTSTAGTILSRSGAHQQGLVGLLPGNSLRKMSWFSTMKIHGAAGISKEPAFTLIRICQARNSKVSLMILFKNSIKILRLDIRIGPLIARSWTIRKQRTKAGTHQVLSQLEGTLFNLLPNMPMRTKLDQMIAILLSSMFL